MPLAPTLKTAFPDRLAILVLTGWLVILGGKYTVRVATKLVTAPNVFVTTTS